MHDLRNAAVSQAVRDRLEDRAKQDLFSNDAGERFSVALRSLCGKFHDVPIVALFPEDHDYPGTLNLLPPKQAPLGLVAIGNVDLLARTIVGICGSRKATDRGLSVAREVCSQLAATGIVVASGYAAGVDETAHYSSLEIGGSTLCVLAEGLAHFHIRKALRDVWSWERALVLSQFGLTAPWRPGRAMSRNATIVALGRATVVVEARGEGGTLNAGLVALRHSRPLFVAEFRDGGDETAGNKILLQNGATPLRRSKGSGAPSITSLVDQLAR